MPFSTYQAPQPYGYGGERLVKAFIDREMVYPPDALKEKIEGNVAIFFVVDTSGNASKVRIVNSVSPDVDKEALRLFHKLEWHPALYLGDKNGSEHIYRFRFDTKKYKKACKKRGYTQLPSPYLPINTDNAIYDFYTVSKKPTPLVDGIEYPLMKYIYENIEYPPAAHKANITGVVKLEYVVEPSGNVSNVRAVHHLGGGCTDEAARIISSARWMPGINDGKAVRTRMVTEIYFGIPPKAGYNLYSP